MSSGLISSANLSSGAELLIGNVNGLGRPWPGAFRWLFYIFDGGKMGLQVVVGGPQECDRASSIVNDVVLIQISPDIGFTEQAKF